MIIVEMGVSLGNLSFNMKRKTNETTVIIDIGSIKF